MRSLLSVRPINVDWDALSLLLWAPRPVEPVPSVVRRSAGAGVGKEMVHSFREALCKTRN